MSLRHGRDISRISSKIPELWRQRREDHHESEANLVYRVRPCLASEITKNGKKDHKSQTQTKQVNAVIAKSLAKIIKLSRKEERGSPDDYLS